MPNSPSPEKELHCQEVGDKRFQSQQSAVTSFGTVGVYFLLQKAILACQVGRSGS